MSDTQATQDAQPAAHGGALAVFDAVDRGFATVALFDWLGPLLALIDDWRHWPVVGVEVPIGAGWGPGELRRMLAERGVKMIGLDLRPKTIRFSVRAAQADYAEYILNSRGVTYRMGKRNRRHAKRGGLLSRVKRELFS